jgi:hypothetical protein
VADGNRISDPVSRHPSWTTSFANEVVDRWKGGPK